MGHCTHGCVMNVINLGNSIIGVSILAMPYCFRKCGILLSLLLIIISGILVRSSCYLLLKAAIMARRRNFEFLAFHTLGSSGKLVVEIGIIGFLIGVCIALFVVIGDLGPPLASEYLMVENTPNLRAKILVCLGLFVALPLGLLRKVDSLTSLSAISIGFYGFLVIKIISEALPKLMLNEWWYEVNWWQPDGILPCLPIFSMALSCQTQLFEFFDTLNDPSLKRMTSIVGGAVHLCSAVYILVGIFGYIAFSDKAITGNILLRLTPSLMTEFIKFGFIVTVVVGFPLCLFPCRTSLHSLLFKQGVSHHDISINFIPDQRFKALTVGLVMTTFGISIMVPNIEFVLGLIGSTIGTIICFILPAVLFIQDTNKNSSEKRMAQVVLFIGMFILVAGTYYTLREDDKPHVQYAEDHQLSKDKTEKVYPTFSPAVSEIPSLLIESVNNDKSGKETIKIKELEKPKEKIAVNEDQKPEKEGDQKRQEPPIPQEPESKLGKSEPSADLDPQALQKEDKELQKDVQKETAKMPTDVKIDLDKQEQLLLKLEAHHQEQKLLIEEQKKVLAELKLHKESHNEVKKTEAAPGQSAEEVVGLKNDNLESSKNVANIPNEPAYIRNNETNKEQKSSDALKPVQKTKAESNVPLKLLPKDKNSQEAARTNLGNFTDKMQSLETKVNYQGSSNFIEKEKLIPNIPVKSDSKGAAVPEKIEPIIKILSNNDTKRLNKNTRDILRASVNQVPVVITSDKNLKIRPLVQDKSLDHPNKPVVDVGENPENNKEAIAHVVKREINTRSVDDKIANEIADARLQNVSVFKFGAASGSSSTDLLYDKEKREMRKLLNWNSSKTRDLTESSNAYIT